MPVGLASVEGRYIVTESGCWQWTGPTDRNGYGKFGRHCAHRRAFVELVGAIPEGHELDHICGNRGCVNPAHLRPLKPSEHRRLQASAFKTHCVWGHEYTPENTGRRHDRPGQRFCIQCQVDRNVRRRKSAPAAVDEEAA